MVFRAFLPYVAYNILFFGVFPYDAIMLTMSRVYFP